MLDVKRLDEILGQDKVVDYLRHDLATGRFNHAYMFLGMRGIGKKALALSFAKSILCANPGGEGFCGSCSSCRRFDQETYSEFLPFFDEGETLKIEQIRRIIEEEHFKKFEGRFRIIFIEHAERMTNQAGNALLKVLEEPLPGTIFIFTATNGDEILPTILSRVEKYYLNTLKPRDLKKILGGMRFEEVPYLTLGTIDEAKVLLENRDEDLMDYGQFKAFIREKNLESIFVLADKLSRKPYLRELLSYYQLEAAASYKESLRSGTKERRMDRRCLLAIDEALGKIKRNINTIHSLEYCFLTIGGIFSEQNL